MVFALRRRIFLRKIRGRPRVAPTEGVEPLEQPTRKKNRLESYDYSQNGAYFITICTKDRKCILSTIVGATLGRPACTHLTNVGRIVEQAIFRIPKSYQDVRLEKYVIMPNHIHLLLMIDTLHGRPRVAPTVSRIVQQTKGLATKLIGYHVFQKSFHDRIIRNDAEYDMIWEYIDTNPARWQQDCFYTEE